MIRYTSEVRPSMVYIFPKITYTKEARTRAQTHTHFREHISINQYIPGICLAQPMVLTNSLSYNSASVCTTIVAAADDDDPAEADEDGEDVDEIPSSTSPLALDAEATVACCIPIVADCVKKSIVMAALVIPSPLPNNVGISGSHCLKASIIFSIKRKQTN